MFDVFNGFVQFDAVWEIMKDNDPVTNQIILCALIDYVAGQQNKKGYELFAELMPLLMDVGESMGVAV